MIEYELVLEFVSGMSLGFVFGFIVMGKIVLVKLKRKGYSTLDSVPTVFGDQSE